MTPDELVSEAPTTKGHGPEAVATLKRVACGLFPFFTPDFQTFSVFGLLRDKWSPRCDPPWDDDDALFNLVERANREFIKHKAAEAAKERAADRAVERAAERQADASEPANPTNKQLAQMLGGMSERRVYDILSRHWTAKREHAEILAQIKGGTVEEWWQPRRSGKRRDWRRLLFKVGAEEFSFRDFVKERADEPDCPWSIFELEAAYESEKLSHDYDSLPELIDTATIAEIDLGSADEASALWDEFERWRGRKVFAAAFEHEPNADAFPS